MSGQQFGAIIVLFVVAVIVSLITGAELRDTGWMRAAIENECAAYNPQTGVFEWKGAKK